MTKDSKVKELLKKVAIPDDANFVGGKRVPSAKQSTMLTLLGNPRVDVSEDCQAVTNARMKPLIVTENVGPFKVTGLRPAVRSLREVMTDVKKREPDLHNLLSSAGMLCVRFVRGSKTAISNHSWGTAIDLKIAGELDPYGDGTVQHGLTLLAPMFNEHGWHWGATFGKEDGMHFECSDNLVRKWGENGEFGGLGAVTAPPEQNLLSLGDRGDEVRAVQETLNAEGFSLLVDGAYGRDTQAAVMQYQSARGLGADGVVGAATWAELHKSRTSKKLSKLPFAP
jgi:hypothetical protein